MIWTLLLLTIAFSFEAVICRPAGVSPLVCLSMFPIHEPATQQKSPSPFFIRVGASSFRHTQNINVTLLAHDARPFIGIILNVHVTGTDDLVGSFVTYPDNKTKTGSCTGGSQNYLTHRNALAVNKMEVTWIAPEEDVGNVTFRATFMESYNLFWIDVKTDLKSHAQFIRPIKNEKISRGPLDIAMETCGSEIGCLLYPSFCTGRECDIGATYRMYSEHIAITMWARTQESAYVSIGLSADRLMGDDQTITCTHANGMSTFQYGINSMQQNYRQSKRGRLTDMTTVYRDGRLYCSFTMSIVMNATTYSGDTVTYDLHHPYYVMIAWGRLHDGTDVIVKHDELPIRSRNKIQFDTFEVHRANALPLLTQIHGMLMLTAWILFVGVTTVIARYYRPMYSDKLVCGTKVWFQLHRVTAITAFVFTAVSFVIIFVDGLSDEWSAVPLCLSITWRHTFKTVFASKTVCILALLQAQSGVHSWLGIAVMSCVCIQLIGGLLRPGPDSRARPVFNYLHRCIGKSVQILSAVTSVIIFNTGYLPKAQEEFGTSILCFWIGVQVIWEVLFEITKRRTSNDKEMPDSSGKAGLSTVMLWCFLSTMVAMLIPAFMTIFFF